MSCFTNGAAVSLIIRGNDLIPPKESTVLSAGDHVYIVSRPEDRNLVQVSINLTDYRKTPIHRVFDMVTREAARYGVRVLESEVIGLIPSAALVGAAEHYLQLERFSAAQILENRLKQE